MALSPAAAPQVVSHGGLEPQLVTNAAATAVFAAVAAAVAAHVHFAAAVALAVAAHVAAAAYVAAAVAVFVAQFHRPLTEAASSQSPFSN